MAFRLNSRDYGILTTVAEHRVLAVRHITALHQRNTRAVRRRLRALREQDLIRIDTEVFGRSRGRPEGLICVSEAGADVLRGKGLLTPDAPMAVPPVE